MNIIQTANVLTLTSSAESGFRYIHTIQKISIAETTLENEIFTDSISSYTMPSDGYYIITEIKLTTIPGQYYYITGDTVYSSLGVEISIEDLLLLDVSGTNIVRIDTDLLNKYNTDLYYINLIKNKFLKTICACDCISKSDKLTIDTLTMGLALIENLVLNLQFYEAQRIIEHLGICNNLIVSNPNCNCNG